MKVARRGMLLSLLLMILALSVSVASTFAWFAINREVRVTNMQLTTKSDFTYLVIKAENDLSAPAPTDVDDLDVGVSASAVASAERILPVRYNASGTGETKWETAAGTNYNNGAALNNEFSAVAAANLDDYVIQYRFYVGLASNSPLAARNLKITSLTASQVGLGQNDTGSIFLPAVSAVVKCGSTIINFEDVNSNTDINTDAAILSENVNLLTVYTIDVFVYVNGQHEDITSANATAANLASFTLSMTLNVERVEN
ncbi:MAG: hypothetical protein IKR12_02640 [Clostridia bacterium]|nr:hypothetical protein [Clostridia bacterium]